MDQEAAKGRLLYDELRRQLLGHESFSSSHASKFSNTYYLLRPAALILAVGVTLAGSLSTPKNILIATLGALATLATGLDSWLKPQVKWKLYDEYNDILNSMLLRLASIGDGDLPALDVLRIELDALVAKYRTARLLD